MIDAHVPVEMLWEASDPLVALAERFGHVDGAAAARWVAEVLDSTWGVRTGAAERVVISAANAMAWVSTSSGPMLAKWSVDPGRFDRLTEVARLTRWLDGQGLPVSAPVPSLAGAPQVRVDGVSMGLQHVVAGDLLDVDRPDQVRTAGAVLARLHGALAAYPGATWFDSPAPEVTGPGLRITAWLDGVGDQVPPAARSTLRALAAAVPSDPTDRWPVQLVHGDVRSSNLLCSGSEVTAVLDLEEARVDHAVVELARAAVLLGTRFRDWAPVPDDVRTTFRAGYESVRPLTPVEGAWWEVLVLWQTLAMVPPGDDPTGWGASARRLLGRVSA